MKRSTAKARAATITEKLPSLRFTDKPRTARDWAELGHETVIWGSHLQSELQPVPEGPVHDALAAVDSGSALDPEATDWAKLRQDLEALLQKPEEQKQQPNQQQN